ncbi:MAG: hypothetical protein ACXWQR_20615 [Ktedonobacterales bacterium]
METQAPPLRQNHFSLLLAQPWASRLIATLGIVVISVGLDEPVAGRVLLIRGDSIFDNSWTIRNWVYGALAQTNVMSGSVFVHLGFEAVYSVLTWGGLALIPLLWRSLSPRGAVALRWTYATWLSLLTLLAVGGLPSLYQFMSQPPRDLLPLPITLEGSYLLPGAAVFPLGVLVSFAALLLMLREPLPAASPAPRTGWQWTAALVLTAGVLIWVIGFYLMPEAVTSACPPVIFSVTQFAHGACAGLDSDQVLAAASSSGSNPITRLFFALIRNFELLVATGCITALGGWTRHLSVKTLAWLAFWPLLALGTALVALHGADVVAQHGFHLTATSSNWRVGPGMVVTFAGIALVAFGQLGLWRELVRRKRTARPQ